MNRSKVFELPEEVRSQLDRRLIATGFRNYTELAEWLSAEGFGISRAAIGRYGKTFQEKVEAVQLATNQAKAIVAEIEDDEGAMSEALIRLMQEKAFSLLMKVGEIDVSTIDLADFGKMVSALTRASVKQKEFMADVRKKTAVVAKSAEKRLKKAGLSPEVVADIKRQILGIGNER